MAKGGAIIMIGLGKPKRGMSMPPKLGAGRPTGKAPRPPKIGGSGIPQDMTPPDPSQEKLGGGSARCPHCGSPVTISPSMEEDMA